MLDPRRDMEANATYTMLDNESVVAPLARRLMATYGYTTVGNAAKRLRNEGYPSLLVQKGKLGNKTQPTNGHPIDAQVEILTNYQQRSFGIDSAGRNTNLSLSADVEVNHRYTAPTEGVRDACTSPSCGVPNCLVSNPRQNGEPRRAGICGRIYPQDYSNPVITANIAPQYWPQVDVGLDLGSKVPMVGLNYRGELYISHLRTLTQRSKNSHPIAYRYNKCNGKCECGRRNCWGGWNDKECPAADFDTRVHFVIADIDGFGLTVCGIDPRSDNFDEIVARFGAVTWVGVNPML
jgi:hypothetical protein